MLKFPFKLYNVHLPKYNTFVFKLSIHLNRPVKIHLDIDTNMKMVGKRFPYYATYKVNYYPLLYSVCDSGHSIL